MTDGGEDIVTDSRRDRREKAMKANEIACSLLLDIDGTNGDFEAFCALCELVQDGILRAWDREERRQAERAMAQAEIAVERDLDRRRDRACERRVSPVDSSPDSL